MPIFETEARKYKKKTPILDERSTPEARAARVKRLRNLANLSRRDMCNTHDLNMFTLKGWELARHGGLPLDGAHKIIKRVAQEGVFCTVEWLLYEEGQGPKVIVGSSAPQETEICSEDDNIKEEIALFQKHYPNAIYYQVNDNSMHPAYAAGDFVAGIPIAPVAMQEMLGMNAVVQLSTGEMLCRNIRRGRSITTFNLLCLNVDADIDNAMITDAELISVAPIIWHRKPRKKI